LHNDLLVALCLAVYAKQENCPMKKSLIIIFLALTAVAYSQKETNTSKGYALEGFDVVAYFGSEAIKGKKEHTASYNETSYKFSTTENAEKFKNDPQKFIPQYGGWCAYAMAAKGKKVEVDPETFEIRDGKLYVFYNSWGNNALSKWVKDPVKYRKKADANWAKI